MLLIIGLFSFRNLLALLVPAILIASVVRAGRQPLWDEAYRRLRRNRIALTALAVICLYGLIAVLDSISWQDSRAGDPASILDRMFAKIPVERTYSAPLAAWTTGEPHAHRLIGRHLLGTDGSGRDILVLTLKGSRTAMIIGGFSTLIYLPIALLTGLGAGYFGKRFDDAVQYLYTVVGSVPDILLLIALLLVLGRGIY